MGNRNIIDDRIMYNSKGDLIKAVHNTHGLQLHDVYVLAFDTYGGKGGKRFVYFDTYHKRHGFILRNCAFRDSHAYEVIPDMTHGHPVYVVWDIDRKLCMMDDTEQWIIKNLKEAESKVLDIVCKHFSAFMMSVHDVHFSPVIGDTAQVAHAEPIDTKDPEKLSLHVRMNIVCKCWNDVKRLTIGFIGFLEGACTPSEKKLLFTSNHDKVECIIDMSVYSQFRCMRKLYQSKRKIGALRLVPYGNSSKSPEDHEVTYHDITAPEYITKWDPGPGTMETINAKRNRGKLNIVRVSKTSDEQVTCAVTDAQIEAIKNTISQSHVLQESMKHTCPIPCSVEAHKKDPFVVTFMFSPCTGCACPVKGERHKNNRFGLEYNDAKKTITLRCFNNECIKNLKANPIRFCVEDTSAYIEDRAALCALKSLACMSNAIKWSETYKANKMDRDYPIPMTKYVAPKECLSTNVEQKQIKKPPALPAGQPTIETCMGVKTHTGGGDSSKKKASQHVKVKKPKVDMPPVITIEQAIKGLAPSPNKDLFQVSDRAMIAIKGQMGLGKTEKLVSQLAMLTDDTSILVVTHSRVFSNKMQTDLKSIGFTCYMEAPPGSITSKRVVCCLDSCPRLKLPSRDGYDVVIVDELLSVLGRASSGFMRHDEVYSYLEHILTVSKVLLFMDAYVDNMFCYQVIKRLEGLRGESCAWIQNTHITQGNRKCQLVVNKESEHVSGHKAFAILEVIKALKSGLKVVVPSSSRSFINDLVAAVKSQFNDGVKIACYTRDTPRMVLEAAIQDPHAAWKEVDLLAYSPSITSGISFKEAHFDCLIGYMENHHMHPMVDSCLQQLFRVRQLSNVPEGRKWNMRVFINNTRKADQITHPVHLGIIEANQDKKITYNLGMLDDGEWEVPTYMLELDEDDKIPSVPVSRKARDTFMTYDKDRMSWTMVLGIIYMRNKSACCFTEIMENTLRNDYGIDIQVMKYVPDENHTIAKQGKHTDFSGPIVPFCLEMAIDDEQFDKLKGISGLGSTAETIVHVPCPDGTQQEVSVNQADLQRAQVFAHELAYKKYGIKKPYDQEFFEQYMAGAGSTVGRKESIKKFFTWKRYMCGLPRTPHENKQRYAHKLMILHSSKEDRNFKLFYDTEEVRYHKMLISGQELLMTLCGQEIPRPGHTITIKNDAFVDNARGYVSRLSDTQFEAVLDTFAFTRGKSQHKNTLCDSPTALAHFVKKILEEAFGISVVKHRWKKELATDTWGDLFSYIQLDSQGWPMLPKSQYIACLDNQEMTDVFEDDVGENWEPHVM